MTVVLLVASVVEVRDHVRNGGVVDIREGIDGVDVDWLLLEWSHDVCVNIIHSSLSLFLSEANPSFSI